MAVFVSTFLHYPKLTHMAFPGDRNPAEGARIFPMADNQPVRSAAPLKIVLLKFCAAYTRLVDNDTSVKDQDIIRKI